MQIVALSIKTPPGRLPLKCKTRTKSTVWVWELWADVLPALLCYMQRQGSSFNLLYPLPESWRGVSVSSRAENEMMSAWGHIFADTQYTVHAYVVIRYLTEKNSIFRGLTQLHISHNLWGFYQIECYSFLKS